MGLCDDLSHCKVALVIAVLMDLLGGVSLLMGVFASLKLNGEECGDILVYSGVLFIVASLAGWVLWYSGNIQGLPPKEELTHLNSTVDRLARRVSKKIFSHRRSNSSQSSRV
ncbi:transmembrane protein 238a [Poeciliopsis prolifica]|uniref:transmembrane protein 238a n=1 Tax=Poeciliopsis prolifica TaxID=188132 RepID=UPI002413E5E9|nr:transmembrane protein 238a [Poeciliopsis prolifica]